MIVLAVDQVCNIDHLCICEGVWFEDSITTLIKVINFCWFYFLAIFGQDALFDV